MHDAWLSTVITRLQSDETNKSRLARELGIPLSTLKRIANCKETKYQPKHAIVARLYQHFECAPA